MIRQDRHTSWDSFDLIIIGGGSGGSSTAKRAAEYGARVCIIERGHEIDERGVRHGAGFGGTCVNVGCVPKKLMFNAAQQREALHGSVALAAGLGFTVPGSAATFDWAGFKARRDAYVQRLTESYEAGWKKAGCEVIQGLASFSGPDTVRVDLPFGRGTRTLTAPHILIACGGRPSVLPIPGAEHGITSDGFFELARQPKKAVVIGAGYIAVSTARSAPPSHQRSSDARPLLPTGRNGRHPARPRHRDPPRFPRRHRPPSRFR